MRLLIKLLKKLAFLVLILAAMGYAVKYGYRFAMQAAGVPQVSTEESDLMGTVLDSALKLVTGSAKKDQLASELSNKLYSGRADPKEMAELGIELKSGSAPPAPANGPLASATPVAGPGSTQDRVGSTVLSGSAKPPQPLADLKKKVPVTVLEKIWDRLRGDRLGLALVPAAFVGMIVVRKFRRKPSKLDEFMPVMLAMQNTNDSEPYDMQHGVHALGSEDFELLVALIYQRQGYRVSMSAGLSGGRGGDFIIARKAEQVLVQCKKLACEHRIAVERVREFHESMVTAGFTRGLYVASCGFSWDARHFAKTKGITLINARTLDQLLTAAREGPQEDLLAVAQWAPKLLQKVTLTPALCPTCDAAMDEIVANDQTFWLCRERPDCRGRRGARKHRKPTAGSAPAASATKGNPSTSPAATSTETKPAPPQTAGAKPVPTRRVVLPRIVSRRVKDKPTAAQIASAAETVLAKPSEPAPPPQAEQEGCRPAVLKSCVPRKRPAADSGPANGGFDRLTTPPSATTASRKLPDASPTRATAGRARPETRS